jgi:hypothetical protein
LRLEGLVDHLNRRLPVAALDQATAPVRAAYKAAGQPDRLQVAVEPESDERLADWLVGQLKR